MSLGRQPPPNPSPAFRNSRPIRLSNPIASASRVTSPPAAWHIWAIALMKLILVARNELAATLISSAVAMSHRTTGVRSLIGIA